MVTIQETIFPNFNKLVGSINYHNNKNLCQNHFMKETSWDLVTPLGFTTPWLSSFTICETTNSMNDESTYKNIPSGDIRTITKIIFDQDLQCQHLKTTTLNFFNQN
jgi:hypothetical protein